jgi:large subunit ribosomal protein L35
MPKMKTHKGTAARFRITKNGKIVRRHAKLNHILSKKSPAQKRRLGHSDLVADSDKRGIKRMLGV